MLLMRLMRKKHTGVIVSEGTVQPFLPLKSLVSGHNIARNTGDIVLGCIFVHFVHVGGLG
jgi:hypothetical protein